MELPELPPLPPAVAIAVRSDRIIQTGYMREAKNTPLHTSDQMREYARQAVLAERERTGEALREAEILLQSLSGSTLSINNMRSLAHEWLEEFAAAIRGEGRSSDET